MTPFGQYAIARRGFFQTAVHLPHLQTDRVGRQIIVASPLLQRDQCLAIGGLLSHPIQRQIDDASRRAACVPIRVDLHGSAYSQIRSQAVDLVCLMGFLLLLPIPADFERRVLNIHPALLPDFGGEGMYGNHVHAAVLAGGRAESGCTVHYCDNLYDHGEIILQRRCPVLPNDTVETLATRVFEEEKKAYPEALRRVLASPPG